MIKCPNCGSTAQVEIKAVAIVKRILLDCKCGCGCHFHTSYNIDDYESTEIIQIDKK